MRESRKLYPIETIPEDVSEIWWNERLKVGMMADRHLDNALNKLQGLSDSSYDVDDDTRRKWINVLVLERAKRSKERNAKKTN